MNASIFLAVLLFVLPKTPPDPALKGWEREASVALPYAAATQHLIADLAAQGWQLVRTERIGEGASAQDIRKFATARGETVIFMTWRIGSAATGYAYRRDRAARKAPPQPSPLPTVGTHGYPPAAGRPQSELARKV